MNRKWMLFTWAALVFVASACSDVLVACSGTGKFPVRVVVLDSVTREPIAPGSRLLVYYDFRVDTTAGASVPGYPYLDSTIAGGPMDTPGVYDVKVEREGYRDWTKEHVLVGRGSGRCGSLSLEPVTLQVLLQPLQ